MAKGLVLDCLEIRNNEKELININHHILPSEILTVMGPSGVGKSTLLSAIIGTLAPVFQMSGRIILDGIDISGRSVEQRRLGLLFQDALLFPHLSVGANLAFGLRAGGSRAERKTRVHEALAEVGLEGFAERDPASLSGGQRARVALMRMLLSEPKALLLDEPFSGLDAERRDQVRNLVFQHARAHCLPVLMVTHDQEDAAAAGGDIVLLEELGTR